MNEEGWQNVAEQATARITALEKLANLTHAEHMLRELPELRDRLLGPAVILTREHVMHVLDEVEAEYRARVKP